MNYQAWAGSLTPDGGTATQPPLPTADLASGLTAAFGVCAALIGRATSGHGTYLDISMTDVMATWTGSAPAGAPGSARGAVTPGYGLFATADGGQVALGVVNEQHFWDALCTELGLGAQVGLDVEERIRRGAELQAAIAAAVATRERDQLAEALVGAGVPVAPVLDRPRCWRAHRSPPSRSGCPCPIRSRPSRRSTSTAGKDSASAA